MERKIGVVIYTAAPVDQSGEAGGAFVKVDGRECLLRSVELFVNRPETARIVVVVDEDEAGDAKRRFSAHFGLTGVQLAVGGPRWLDQAAAALPKLPTEATHVILHDAARPIVPFGDIDALIEAAGEYPAAALSSPVRGTLVEVDGHGHAKGYAGATRFLQLLTPQIFTREQFEKMASTGIETAAHDLGLVKGSPLNLRVGGPGDERLARTMLGLLPKPKVAPTGNPFEEAQW
jgi:2-C-methyl-D-erythritol 4-phosphate cytidylyltransferase